MTADLLDDIAAGFRARPGHPLSRLRRAGARDGPTPPPASPEALVARLTAKTTVPHKVRNNLTGAAQYIENFKHRKTLTVADDRRRSAPSAQPNELHRMLADLPALPLLVHAWYDDLPQKALARPRRLGHGAGRQPDRASRPLGQLLSPRRQRSDRSPIRASSPSDDCRCTRRSPDEARAWATLLYQPLGSVAPAANFLVSDSDFVEVLTEIDIQTPIPLAVQELRTRSALPVPRLPLRQPARPRCSRARS